MDEIRKQQMIQIYTKDSGPLDNLIFVWNANADDQLSALVASLLADAGREEK